MLGKMGVTVGDCITRHEELSKKIFGKRYLKVKVTDGLAPTLDSGKGLRDCVRNLLADGQLHEDLFHEA